MKQVERNVARARLTLPEIARFKTEGQHFTVLTAYDAPMARILVGAGVPMLLVGDSLGNVVLGHRDPVPVTMQDMLHHCQAVRRGAPDTFIVGDLPFLSYQVSIEEAVRNAGLLVKDGLVDAVKLEGGRVRAETVRRIVDAGIPVMGHLGLTPQSATLLGGLRMQARTAVTATMLIDDAFELERAGVFSIVLECVPARVAARVTGDLSIPTIGIGAGPQCTGQVLVTHDLLGLSGDFRPKFVRRYAELEATIGDAIRAFVGDVASQEFPGAEESFEMSAEDRAEFEAGSG